MGKDLKEKYERVCGIKDKALCLVESQMNGDLANVDAEELGEVADIAKDMAELMKYCAEAEYYHKVTEAMDEGSKEENSYYLNKYIPEYEGKFYDPMYMTRMGGRRMYTPYDYMDEYRKYDDSAYRDRMYYSRPDRVNYANGGRTSGGNLAGSSTTTYDSRMGRSGMTRRMYMDMKEKGEDVKMTEAEMKKYMAELVEDFEEMLDEADPAEKAQFKSSLVSFINRM